MSNLFEPDAPAVTVAKQPEDKLRIYQRDVINRGRQQIARGRRRGIIQAETGAGKTYMEAEMARLCVEKGMRCLILADRRKLIKQIGKTLDVFGLEYGVIMQGDTRATFRDIVLASRDTLSSWVERKLDMPAAFNLVQIDEAHKSLGDVYQDILRLWPNAVTIGFTATPARSDGKAMSSYYQWLECAVPASQLVAEGWLIKPEVYVPLELAKQRRKKQRIKGLAGNPVEHWQQHADGLPTIAFASNVSESMALRDKFLGAGIIAEHIDAQTPDDDSPRGRDAVYKRLASGETKIVCSVGLCIEGLDVPEVSCAILWAKFGSIVQLRQACGRIMRPAPWINKTRAVVLDHAGACGEHGLPGEDVEWSLDQQSTIKQRRKQALDDGRCKEPAICRQCGCMFQAPKCPSCGWVPIREKRSSPVQDALEARDEILSRYDGKDAVPAVKENYQRVWNRCIGIAIGKQRTAGMAASMFSKQFGMPPWEARVKPMPIDWKLPAREAFPDFGRCKAS